MRVKKTVIVSLSKDEKGSLGRLFAHMGVGFIFNEDSPVDCYDLSCEDCPFNRDYEISGYYCLINQIVSLKLELRSILERIEDAYNIEV
ncbi:hypothetical protein [Thomasclavelia cocleata]|uniref:hypothetical protein n=1 Tax=Thomasclavelia cocleata TaxID=69824 RepID=UPI0025B77905|nr:hypothetical protein [Thomasclavelia cocleata]